MATRSYLIAAVPGPEATVIYCHHGSETYRLGLILNLHYDDPVKVNELLRHGPARSIEPEIENCLFMNRTDIPADHYPSLDHALRDGAAQWYLTIEYVYLYRAEHRQWAVIIPRKEGNAEPAPISPEIIAEDIIKTIKPDYWNLYLDEMAKLDPEAAAQTEIRLARRASQTR